MDRAVGAGRVLGEEPVWQQVQVEHALLLDAKRTEDSESGTEPRTPVVVFFPIDILLGLLEDRRRHAVALSTIVQHALFGSPGQTEAIACTIGAISAPQGLFEHQCGHADEGRAGLTIVNESG